jgi:hypothetical protein
MNDCKSAHHDESEHVTECTRCDGCGYFAFATRDGEDSDSDDCGKCGGTGLQSCEIDECQSDCANTRCSCDDEPEVAAVQPQPRPCAICSQPTTGCVGAAGIKWVGICQPCKDREDRALAVQVEAAGKHADRIFATIFGARNAK